MKPDSNSALPSPPTEERPTRDLLLLVSCILGILVGLGIFGFVCYLLMR
jgi:hypothetical protein